MRAERMICLGLLLALAGCGTRKCKSGTLLLSVQLAGDTVSATELDISVEAGGRTMAATIPHTGGSGTVEVDFGNGYPTGATATVTVTALSSTDTLGSGTVTVALSDKCEAASVSVTAGGTTGDMAVGADMATGPDMITVIDVPAAPTNVTATPAAGGAASVTWTAPSDNGSAITGYTVTSSPGNLMQMVTAPPANFTGLTVGTTYTFTVTATNAIGTGPAGTSNSIVASDIPAAPTQVSTCAGNGFVKVYWLPSAGATSYNVYYSSTTYPVTLGDAGTTKITGAQNGVKVPLANGTATHFTVTAVNSLGESAPAAMDTFDTATGVAYIAAADMLFVGVLGATEPTTSVLNIFDGWSGMAASGATPSRSISSVDTQWSGIFVDKELATLYVSVYGKLAIWDHLAGSANAAQATTRTVTYPANIVSRGVAVDTTRNILYLYNYNNSTGTPLELNSFYPACRVSGTATPIGTITGNMTTFGSTVLGIAVDSTTDTVFVNNGANVIAFSNASATRGNVNVAPSQTISVQGVALNLNAIAIDPGRALLYLTDSSSSATYRMPETSNGVVTVAAGNILSGAAVGMHVANNFIHLGNASTVTSWASANTVSGSPTATRTVTTSTNFPLGIYYVP